MSTSQKKQLLVILGPTGTGKTGLAFELLGESGLMGEIISADSRQVYHGLDYTTNKLDPCQTDDELKVERHEGYWLQRGVRINLYDVVAPTKNYSVAEFVATALGHLERIWHNRQLPVVVGGTGFYIDALLGQSPYSEVGPDRRLRRKLSSLSTHELVARLRQLDSLITQDMSVEELNNCRRLVRYIELAVARGSVRAALKWSPLRKAIKDGEITIKKVGLTASREILYQRADQWVRNLATSPYLINETRQLMSSRPRTDRVLRGLIYAPTMQFIDGQIDRIRMIKIIQGQLHRYIRSQLGWFKRSRDAKWIKIEQTDWLNQVGENVHQWYDG